MLKCITTQNLERTLKNPSLFIYISWSLVRWNYSTLPCSCEEYREFIGVVFLCPVDVYPLLVCISSGFGGTQPPCLFLSQKLHKQQKDWTLSKQANKFYIFRQDNHVGGCRGWYPWIHTPHPFPAWVILRIQHPHMHTQLFFFSFWQASNLVPWSRVAGSVKCTIL